MRVEALRIRRGDERALDEVVRAQRLDDAPLVAGDLQVDVELERREARARRGARAPPRASAACARRRRRSRARAAARRARVRPAVGAERRQHVELDHVDAVRRAPRRSSRACCRARSGRRPCGRRGAVAARLSAGIRGTSRSCGCRRPGRAARIACRSGGRGGRRGRRRGGRVVSLRARAAARSMRGRTSRDHGERLRVGDVAQPAPRVDLRAPAALGLPDVADAGDDPLVEQRVADRARRVVLAQPPQEALRRRTRRRARRARARRAAGRSACEPSVISSSTGPSNSTTSCPRARSTSQARRGARRQRAPWR